MEIWKEIKGFENYQVSVFGHVKRIDCIIENKKGVKYFYKEKILKQESSRGYKRVTLSKNGITSRFMVHRLVAITFIDNTENKPCVNHINGVKTDNDYFNLEWCTYSENEQHSYNVLKKVNANRKLSNDDVLYIKNNTIKGKNNYERGNVESMQIKFSVTKNVILNVINGKYYV